MTEDKIINFPISTPEQYKAYLKAEETTMMKIAGKMGYVYGTIYAFFDCLKIESEVSKRHFIKHQKRKRFQVVDEYYGRNTSFARHILNQVLLFSLEKKQGRAPE